MTSGLLNAYASILGLPDGVPELAAMHLTKTQVRKLVRAAIDNPANMLHVHSLADVNRTESHLAALDSGTVR